LEEKVRTYYATVGINDSIICEIVPLFPQCQPTVWSCRYRTRRFEREITLFAVAVGVGLLVAAAVTPNIVCLFVCSTTLDRLPSLFECALCSGHSFVVSLIP